MAAIKQLNANLSDFIYTVTREAPLSAKRRLPEKYFIQILTDKSAKRFAAKSTYEQKREFLSYLGIEQFTVFADLNRLGCADIREVLHKIDLTDKPSSILKKLAEDNVFISSNREFCYSLLNVAQWFNTSVYVKNLDLIRSAFHPAKWGKELDHEIQENVKIENEALTVFIKFVYAVALTLDVAETIAEVDAPTTQMLLHLYMKKGYETQENISLATGLSMRQVYMSTKKCMDLFLVQRHPRQETVEFQIATRGILNINKFITKIIHQLDFQ